MGSLQSRIRISWKLLLIAMLAVLGLAVPVYQLDMAIYNNLTRIDKEREAIEPINNLLNMMARLQKMRGQAQIILGGNATTAEYQRLLGEVKQEFLPKIQASSLLKHSATLQKDLSNLQVEVDKISADVLGERLNDTQSFTAHTEMILHVRGFIDDFAEVSGLSLDPEQATYYLMLVTVTHVPDLIQNLAQTRGLGIAAINDGVGGGEKRGQMRGLLNMTDRILFFMQRDLGRSFADSPEIRDRLQPGMQNVAAKVGELKTMSEREILNALAYNIDTRDFFAQYTQVLDEVLSYNYTALKALDEQLEYQHDAFGADFTRSAVLSVLALAVMLALIAWVGISILRSFRVAIDSAQEIANGNLRAQINEEGDYDTRRLLGNLKAMQQELLKRDIETARTIHALDAASTSLMLADENNVIVYTNKAVQEMFKAAEADIRQDLPRFDAASVVGRNIDQFHKNPAYQQGMLEKLKEPHKAQINIGPRTMAFTATPVFGNHGDRIGTVVEWRDRTAELKAQAEEQLRQAALDKIAEDNARIKSALDNVSANVMIASPERDIIYMNKSVAELLQKCERDIRKDLPMFNASKLIGGSIDQFHKSPEHQARMLAQLSGTHRAQIEVGGLTFALVVTPVFDDDGDRLGTAVQWIDRTEEVRVEKEVGNLVNAASAGDFTQRLDVAGKMGFFKRLSEDLNTLMVSVEDGLRDLQRMLEGLAKGDLTVRVTRDYSGIFADLKGYSNQTAESLADMLGQIRESADTIFTAASEIAQGNSDLSSRTEQQASSLEETASSMEELTSTVRNNADNARQANSLAMNASQVATSGGDVVQKVVHTMAAINDSARKIADIIGVIDGIAFQTNILALNAAVEAARAGEQGRGFAVVAAEVRNLAQRSASAAKEIKSLIEDSVNKVEDGNSLVAQAGSTMSEIVVSIQKVTDIMADIAAASAEQSTGIEEVNRAVSQMDEMTQQNAALVEEAAASAEALQGQSNMLSQSVAVFKLDDRPQQSKLAASKPVVAARPMATRSLPKVSKSAEDEWEEF
ncbi:Methyl-accepting chemotaxis protein [Atopomonas hussainii]|uniref:Methyl-accepting chemotaxis protein n=1 Tax=Atopomonas hussainii TaxID=1429083 RepID=A0A1H7SXL4_9GAMM|nr:Methyl-accepting chemotaxis protein [Atopomonas hussainii]